MQRPGELERRRDDPGWLDYDVAREGLVLYADEGVSVTVRPPSRVVRECGGNRPRFASTAAWLDKAHRDLAVAEQLITHDEVFWDSVCFHAHQAAEKSLRALMIQRGQHPGRTHELVKLLQTCRDAGWTDLELDAECERLSPYAVATRYPSRAPVPSELDGRAALDAAHSVLRIVDERLQRLHP